MKKNKKIKRVLSFLFLFVVLMSVLVLPFNANAWNDEQMFNSYAYLSKIHFNFRTFGDTAPSNFTYGYMKTFGSMIEIDYSAKLEGYYGWTNLIQVPLNGTNISSSLGTDIYNYAYFEDRDTMCDSLSNILGPFANSVTEYDEFVFNTSISSDEINSYMGDIRYYSTFDTQLGYLCYWFYVYGNVELGIQASADDFYGFLTVDHYSTNKAFVNTIYGANDLVFDCHYSDTENHYMFALVIPIWNTREVDGVFDYYKHDFSSAENWSRYHQSLENGIDKGYSMGESANLGDNILGTTLNAPIDALNEFVLFTVGDVNVTLGGVVGCVIALTLFIVFLKMFAGG